jgi:hypothetical protein
MMSHNISGPSSYDNNKLNQYQNEKASQVQPKKYVKNKNVKLAAWLKFWFPDQVTDKMVSSFEQNMIKMLQNEINRNKRMHDKTQKEIKRRIENG